MSNDIGSVLHSHVTVYGDIYAVNSREMIFIMIYVTSDILLGVI